MWVEGRQKLRKMMENVYTMVRIQVYFYQFPLYKQITNQIQNNNQHKINKKMMQEMHTAIMRKTKNFIKVIKLQAQFLSTHKSKISCDLLTETINRKQQIIKKELRETGAVLGDKFEEILKAMKSKNFDLMSLIEKGEQDLDRYYQLNDQDTEDMATLQIAVAPKKHKTVKTKKIRKQRKPSKEVKIQDQIYEESMNQEDENFYV